jgi:putative sterol carrier protein
MNNMTDSLHELFAKIPDRFDSAAWGERDAVFQFEVSGDEAGQWYAAIQNGELTLGEGASADPDMTVKAASGDLLDIINGELNAVNAFMQGKVKLDGDLTLAMKLQALLGL